MHADEKAPQAVQFLDDVVAYYGRLGLSIKRLLADNGSDFAKPFVRLGIKHQFTRPAADQRQS